MTRSRQTADWGSRAGLAKIVPSSVAVGSGTGSASTTGLVTFSAVSSLSLNDVFSTTYDNYRVVCRYTTTATGEIKLRFRVSAADNTTSNYGDVTFTINNTTTRTQNVLASSSLIANATDSTNEKSFSIDIVQPFTAVRTQFTGTYAGIGGDVTGDQVGLTGGGFDATTSFTGFTLIPNAGTFTGTVSVYGYN